MSKAPPELDLDSLDLKSAKALLAQQAAELLFYREEMARAQSRIAYLQRQLFGRRSERCLPQDAAQLLLDFAACQQAELQDQGEVELEVPEEGEEEWEEAPSRRKKKRKGHGRTEIPEGLTRIREEYPLPPEERACQGCGETLEKIGEVVREELEHIPAALFVRQHVRFKYACKQPCCQERPPVTAPPPVRPIDRGRVGPGLLAQVLVGKYDDHLPLNRMEKIFRRQGASISRSSMSDWVGRCADVLRPLYDHLQSEVLSSRVIHTDDTEVPVQEPGRGQTRKGRLWVYLGDDDHSYVVFDYTPSRARAGPVSFLSGFEGYLQADAYAGYKELYRHGKVTEVACWAHVRRKFHDAQGADQMRSTQALGFIRALYAIERRAKDLTPNERGDLRQKHARPILEQLKKWLEDASTEVLPKGPMGEAVGYALNLWPSLLRYLDQGELSIDNNDSEREMKAVVIGRKNWLFAGSDEGGHRSAVIYSLVRSARRIGLDPYRYLGNVLDRIRLTPPEEISNLAPDRWLKNLEREQQAAHPMQEG